MDTATGAARKRHILIVDDDADLAWFFQELLKLHGYETTIMSDGVPALKHALHHHVDVILCDLQMTKLDGDLFFATIERVKPALARRFIFVTGLADEARFQKFVSTVEVPVLRKPVPAEKLLDEIERVARGN